MCCRKSKSINCKRNTNSLLKIPANCIQKRRYKQTKVFFVKYCIYEWILFYFWNRAKVSLVLSVCVWVVLFEVIKSKHTHTPPTKETENPMLCLFYFILLFFWMCFNVLVWYEHTYTFFSFHIIIMWMALSYAALHSDFREISMQSQRRIRRATNGYSHLFFFLYFKDWTKIMFNVTNI